VTMVYLLIFPSVIKLRYSHPDVPRPYRIPWGKFGLWAAGILTTAWCALTTIAIIYPGIGTAHPDDSLPEGFEHQRLEYTLSQVIPLVVMIGIGLLFYALGAPTRRQARAEAASAAAAPTGEASSSEASSSEAVPGEAPSSDTTSSEAASSETPTSETTSSDTTSG